MRKEKWNPVSIKVIRPGGMILGAGVTLYAKDPRQKDAVGPLRAKVGEDINAVWVHVHSNIILALAPLELD